MALFALKGRTFRLDQKPSSAGLPGHVPRLFVMPAI